MSDKLREAATRLLNEGMGAIDRPPWVAKAVSALVRDYFAKHPADDGEPVTREWLFDIGFVESVRSAVILRKPANDDLFIWAEGNAWNPAFENGYRSYIRLAPCKTRGDVRRLLKALKVEVKG